jgi:hypothetical protein
MFSLRVKQLLDKIQSKIDDVLFSEPVYRFMNNRYTYRFMMVGAVFIIIYNVIKIIEGILEYV